MGPEYIVKLYHLIKTTGSDISVCNFIRTSDEDIEVDKSNIKTHVFSNIEALIQLSSGKYSVQLTTAWGKLYRNYLFDGIRYPLGKIHEDEFVAHYLLFKAQKVVLTTEQLLYYWQRPDSIMGRGFNIQYRHDAAHAIVDRARFLKTIGLIEQSDRTYRTAFRIYASMMEFNSQNNIYKKRDELIEEFNELKNELRKGEHSIRFKTYYELYYASPYVMGLAHKIYSKSNGLRRRLIKIPQQSSTLIKK